MTTISTPIDGYGALGMAAMGLLADPVYPPNPGEAVLAFSFEIEATGGASATLAFAAEIAATGGASATLEMPAFEIYAFGGSSIITGTMREHLRNPFALAARGGASLASAFGPFALDATGTVTNVGRLAELIGMAGDPRDIDIRFSLNASGQVADIGRMAVTLRNPFSLTARGGGIARMVAPPFALDADGTTGIVGRGAVAMRFALDASGQVGTVGRAALTFPAFEMVYRSVMHAEMPAFVLSASGSIVPDATTPYAYAVNLATGDVTRYTNFNFNFLLRFAGETVGMTGEGLFVLGGDVDERIDGLDTAQDPIAAAFELAPSDFGTAQHKRLPYAYLGVAAGEALRVTATADSTTAITARTATVGRNRRAKLARGVKGRFWSLKVENIEGNDFAVDAVEMLPMHLGRKV